MRMCFNTYFRWWVSGVPRRLRKCFCQQARFRYINMVLSSTIPVMRPALPTFLTTAFFFEYCKSFNPFAAAFMCIIHAFLSAVFEAKYFFHSIVYAKNEIAWLFRTFFGLVSRRITLMMNFDDALLLNTLKVAYSGFVIQTHKPFTPFATKQATWGFP